MPSINPRRLPGCLWSAALLCALSAPLLAEQDRVLVDINVDKPTAELSPVLYGLFFEDINYAADGGLYAELVQNRSFEYYAVQGRAPDSARLHPLSSWRKVEREGGAVDLEVVDTKPLNENNTKYLKITTTAGGVAGVSNSGFGGIALDKGARYDFSVYASRSQGSGSPLRVSLVSQDGKVLASGEIAGVSDGWKKHELTLTAAADASHARLEVTTAGKDELLLDMVSLFPRDTFKGRKNGMRKDLASALADLKPGFLRFPGGCIAHGHGLKNAYRWKDTVGDLAERKPNWNLWGYHQTYGLGYFEYMQLCEDIGATPLPVIPVGVSCGFRQPFQCVAMDKLHTWIDDALDLIEFANGPVDSEWGKLRAKMGHAEPFNLEYVCLGNEEHDNPEVRERFPLFVDAIRARYPDIKIVGTSGLGAEIPLYDLMTRTRVYSSDEHYYMSPSWYLGNVGRFDNFDRSKPKIFVGEYASQGNTQYNAVSEAAYLTGIERNADIVDMTCYAPLFAKYGDTQWPQADLIWFTNQAVVRTPNYYVQQLFSRNKGDVYLDNKVEVKSRPVSDKHFAGRLGIGAWSTSIEVESASLNSEPIGLEGWDVLSGDFAEEDGLYAQRDQRATPAVSVAPVKADGRSDVFRVRARKTGGSEGFLLVFGFESEDSYYWWNVAGWGNTEHALQRRAGQRSQDRMLATRGSIETGKWYDLRVELSPGQIRCFLDDQLVHEYHPKRPEVTVSSTFDRSSGEALVKLVNPAEEPATARLRLHGELNLGATAHVTTLSGSPGDVNTVESQPVRPLETDVPASDSMELVLPPCSVQVVRVKVK